MVKADYILSRICLPEIYIVTLGLKSSRKFEN